MPFTAETTSIDGLLVIRPQRFPDDRGWFMETYKESGFAKMGITETFVQDNHSVSARGALRGLHFQLAPHAQGKLVTVVRGAVWDVAVDIRPASITFGRWYGLEIRSDEPLLFYMPPGFAHGFCALENNTRFVYKCTAEYNKESERGIRYDDPELAISWPVERPGLSAKDAALPSFADIRRELS